MKRFRLFLVSGLAAVAIALVPSLAFGHSLKSGDSVTIPKGEAYQGSVWAAGRSITIDGDVFGDVWCAGNTIRINGTIHGDVLCAGNTITINGDVDGNVRAAGQTVDINGRVGHNISVGSQSFTVGTNARVEGEIAFGGQDATIGGPIGQELYGTGQNITIAAPIARDVNVHTDNLKVVANGHVGGSLIYTSKNTFDFAPGQVAGTVTRHDAPLPEPKSEKPEGNKFLSWLSSLVFMILSALVLALVLVWLTPRFARFVTDIMRGRPGASVGFGALALIGVPILFLVLLLTIIGIMFGLLLLGTWLLALLISAPLVGIAIGRWILPYFNRDDDTNSNAYHWRHSLLMAALVGVPLVTILFSIPWIGGLAMLVGMCWALGGIVISLSNLREAKTITKNTKTLA